MKPEKLVQLLTETVRRIGFRVRTEEGNFRGGSCVFAEERLVILNRRMTQEERAEILARVLAAENLDDVFLLPEVRGYIEKFVPKQEPASEVPNVPEGSAPPAETPPASDEETAQ